MKKLQDLAIAIDAASDAGDEEALRQLGKECEESLDGATGEDRVFLLIVPRRLPSMLRPCTTRGTKSACWPQHELCSMPR